LKQIWKQHCAQVLSRKVYLDDLRGCTRSFPQDCAAFSAMTYNGERLPPQASFSSLSGSDDGGDARRSHIATSLSNSLMEDSYPPRLSRESNLSQHSTQSQDSSKYNQARQPINDAVRSAFDTNATTNTAIAPEVLQQITSQITANVLQQLKASNLPLPNQQPPHSMDAASLTAADSPPLDRSTVYTPPTPHRYSDEVHGGHASPSFPPPPNQSDLRRSPGTDQRPISPLSQASHLSESEANQSRPRGPKRVSTNGDMTIVERVWGQLFTEQGHATPRLGQFLRGIAVHLIEDYEPKHSLVITPAKMQRYYEETKLSNELYPWKVVFDDRTSSISRMFRDVECQHHLVQEKVNERPDLPGLTPQGFENWATLLLKAHPDQEFERLAKTALDMPISNPDEKKERFPKELSRRLFPTHGDTEVSYKLQKAMSVHCNVNFTSRNSSTASNPPLSTSSIADDASSRTAVRTSPEKQDATLNAPLSSMTSSVSSIERERKPYGGSQPAESVNGDSIENTEDVPTPQPIERERKPYVAVAGRGKNYDIVDKPNYVPEPKPSVAPSSKASNTYAPVKAPTEVPKAVPPPIAIHQNLNAVPVDIPETRPRPSTQYHQDPPRSGRNRSPSASKENGASTYARRTEPEVAYMSSSYHSDHHDDARRYKDYEAGRERLANDRYDAARMAAYDPRERGRDQGRRPRMQSISSAGTGFVDVARSPTLRSSAAPQGAYPSSFPPNEDEYYLSRVSSNPNSSNHYSSMGGPPASISTGFPPPPPPVSNSSVRDPGYGYPPPASGVHPPSSYKDIRYSDPR
jgi:hypothetical protein